MSKKLNITKYFIGFLTGVLTLFGYHKLTEKDRVVEVIKIKEKINKEVTTEMTNLHKRSDERIKAIKRKYGIVIKCLTLIALLTTMAHAEYIRYDKRDKVWIDYGSTTNYIKCQDEVIDELYTTRSSNVIVVTNAVGKSIDDNCLPTWWQRNGDWATGTGVTVLCILIFL